MSFGIDARFRGWGAGWIIGLWLWVGWSCGGDWRFNPQYSYGPWVPLLAGYFLYRRISGVSVETLRAGPALGWRPVLFTAICFLPIEWMRQQMPAMRLIFWIQASIALWMTLAWAWATGGRANFKILFFPAFFLLLSVPWPTRFEEPLTRGMMSGVAEITEEILHWIGIYARREGEVIFLKQGMVGVSEACSGVRSLQGAIMVSLAVGELFLLPNLRRVILLGLGIGLAFIGNLIRTTFLCWIGERQGLEALESVHDTGGNSILIGVTLIITGIAWRMSRDRGELAFGEGIRAWWNRLAWDRLPDFRFPWGIVLASVMVIQGWYWHVERNSPAQSEPEFEVRNGVPTEPIAAEVWRNLRPSSGEAGQWKDPSLPMGAASWNHFFWRPVARNAVGHLHRPDACMGGVGWKLGGAVRSQALRVSGKEVVGSLLYFERPGMKAIQWWGVWKNGETAVLDFASPSLTPPLVWRDLLRGQRRAGVEIVSVVIGYRTEAPEINQIEKVLNAVFD